MEGNGGGARDLQVKVRLNAVERGALDALAAEVGAGCPADVVRALLLAYRMTEAGRQGLPMLAAHGEAAVVEAAARIERLREAEWAKVPERTLWDGDPGVRIDPSAIDPSLPAPDTVAVRNRLARALQSERDTGWRHPHRSIEGAVKALEGQARHARAVALEAVLREDAIDGVVLGWRRAADAGRALGLRFHPGVRGGNRKDLPVAVVIGAGEDALAAHRAAQAAGHGREVREAAEEVPAGSATLDIVTARLRVAGPVVDLHALAEDVKRGRA